MKKIFFLAVILTMICSSGFAETIYFNDGRVINNARIIGRNSYSVTISTGRSHKRYFLDQIKKIEDDAVKKTDEEELEIDYSFSDFEEGLDDNENIDAVESIDVQTSNLKKAKNDLMLELFEANGMRKNIENDIQKLILNVPPERKEELVRLLNVDEILESIIPVYDKHFSDTEVENLIIFYNSAAGQKILQLAPQITGEVMAATIEYFKDKIRLHP